MKVMHAICKLGLGGGGSEEIAIGLALNHASRGHQCCVVAMTRSDSADDVANDYKSRLAAAGVAVHELGAASRKFSMLLAPPFLIRLVGRWKPDIVHSHTDIPDLCVALARRIRKFPVARTIHSTSLWPTHSVIGRVAESAFDDDLVISVSADAEEAYVKFRQGYGLSVSRYQLRIPNGVEVPTPTVVADRSFLAREFGADPQKVQFCFAGRFEPAKGFDILCDALSGLSAEDRTRLEVHAFGSGSMLPGYRRRARRERLPISFHPPVPSISGIFQAFDAVLVPSRFEGLPLVALEALSAGVPILASTAPGLREAFPPGWPLAFTPEYSPQLTRLLADFLDHRYDVQKLSGEAKAWAVDHFGFDKMCERYETGYKNFLGKHDH
jgi:glycosyltransferase involved in cell wall biosynthesis